MLELQALGSCALLSGFRSVATAEQRARQAIELARKHGWDETTSAAATAYVALGGATLWRGRLAEAEGWLDRAERVLEHATQPTAATVLRTTRAFLESARGRHVKAAAAYRDAEPIEGLLVMPHMFATREQALKLETLVHLGETERVVRALADMNEQVRETTQMRVVLAVLRLAHDDPEGAADALAPILVDSTRVEASVWGHQGAAARGDREARRASRSRSVVARARGCARLRRVRGLAASVPAASSAGAARASLATSDHSRCAHLRDPRPAIRTRSASPAERRRAAPGSTLGERASRAALPADQPVGAGDRQ